jgi:YihY family inner membrane protein
VSISQRLKDLWRFIVAVLRSFHANQGLLLAGALAYYTLLSVVPLFTLLLVVLSHVVPEDELVVTLEQYLSLVTPGQSATLVDQVTLFLSERELVGWVTGLVLLFFSSIAFSVLESAMSVIFYHRLTVQRRHFLISAIIPYLFILLLGVGFLLVTVVATGLQAIEDSRLALLGLDVPLSGLSHAMIYLIGLVGQILILSSIYMVLPVGRLSWRKALVGGTAACLVWEASRHALVWYFSTLSFVNVIYGSLATVVFLLLGLEVAALILLLGAQVIAEYERWESTGRESTPPG